MSIFLNILILLVILASMVMVLLGIGHLARTGDYEDNIETKNLRTEIENSEEVVSENNMFHKLVEETKHKLPENTKELER